MSTDAGPIQRRAKPRLLLLDESLKIAYFEASALELLERVTGQPCSLRLPAEVESSIRAALSDDRDDQAAQQIIMPAPTLVMRVSRLKGHNGAGRFIALLLEQEMRRAPLSSAGGRYSLTKRETEVLRLLLRGIATADVARELSISETTVTSYFKNLLRKTGAHSRSEMVAKVLGWDEGDSAPASQHS